jgi:hypothetical protein
VLKFFGAFGLNLMNLQLIKILRLFFRLLEKFRQSFDAFRIDLK